MNMTPDLPLSLILATRNHARMLDGLLINLAACELPPRWELLIVDNGSSDDTAKIINLHSQHLPLKYLYEPRPGKSRALNRGLREASGEIIVFTDDDIIPDRHWLVNILRVMTAHPQVNVLGGRIRVNKSGFPAWLINSYNLSGLLLSEHDLGDTEIHYAAGRYPFGPNLTVRRKLLATTPAPWPVDVGPGTRLAVGDETVFVQTISHRDDERLYSPACVVEHKLHRPGHFFRAAIKRCFAGGQAAGLYGRAAAAGTAHDSILALAARRMATCRSLQEFCCITARAAGFFYGRIARRFSNR